MGNLKLTIQIVKILLYAMSFSCFTYAIASFVLFIKYNYSSFPVVAKIIDISYFKVRIGVRGKHKYRYTTDDGNIETGSFIQYNSTYEINDLIEVSCSTRKHSNSHYSQPTREILNMVVYSSLGIYILWEISKMFSMIQV